MAKWLALGALALVGAGAALHFAAPTASGPDGAGPGVPSKAATGDCAVETVSSRQELEALREKPRVLVSSWRDPDSGEPVVRDLVDFGDGTTVVVEQQNCAIANLRVTLLSPLAMPDDRQLTRMAAVLALTPLWKRQFASLDPRKMLRGELASEAFRKGLAQGRSFDYATHALPPAGENDEAVVSFMTDEEAPAPFRSSLTLTIAASPEGG
ncbi:hypothetical protein SAMN05518801_12415 [Novosphingobium sp. CF614]|uniref:hypothetical protein n=1 Tax=Novosphingobium sp. CF614 TaxID=1884364 RepID=UPI0008E5BEF2|nr:hypothetical protein [Novosphingobium sp. CF614]SFG41669.1 hypothetical protein SAMN05518801_12415 [Novosphingobium sp. CF614]